MTYLKSWKKYKTVRGRLYYSEPDRAWNSIRFKRELLEEFKALTDRQSKFFYEMMLFYQFEELEDFIKQLKKEGKAPPMMFRFGRTK